MNPRSVLIVDVEFYPIAAPLDQQGYFVFNTGPVARGFSGMESFFEFADKADIILLCMDGDTTEEDTQTIIVEFVSHSVPAKIVGITSETAKRRIFRSLGVIHTPNRVVEDVVRCVEGTCGCSPGPQRTKG